MKRISSALVTVLTSGSILAFTSLTAAAAHAGPNLVQNGGFETNGGPGFIDWNQAPHPQVRQTTAANWQNGSYGYRYNIIASLANLQATSDYYVFGLWGATPGYQNGNGFTTSPNGGWFLQSDGFDVRTPLEQTISGLDVGSTYTLSFQYARSQEASQSGDSFQKWRATFGSESFETPNALLPSHGFDGWYTATHQFTAATSTQVLSFLAFGTNGVPPFLLLDGVSLTANDPTPPSPAATPGPLPLLGIAAAFAWSGKLRRRIQSGANRQLG
jgi:MYXO-CTERM domain-containing protein